MNIILTTTIVIALIGLLVGMGLVAADKKFSVEVDERENAIREALPGNNCGACGYAGCDAMAQAIAQEKAPANGCSIGGAAAAKKIAEIMGIHAEAPEQMVAFVRCNGTCDVTKNQGNYIGVKDCRSVAHSGLIISECAFGCLGLGACAAACPQNAIVMKDGVAAVDRQLCVGCGLCVRTCPRGLIELIPRQNFVAVKCSNREKGAQVRRVCATGCIGCGICEKTCEYGAIFVDGNVAKIHYDLCSQCGHCVSKCPSKIITSPLSRSVR